MIVFLLANWKAVLAAAVALVIGLSAGYARGHWVGDGDGRAALLAEQAIAAANNERERVKNDAALRNLSDRALCLRALGAERMHDCDAL